LGRHGIPLLVTVGEPLTVSAEEDPVTATERLKAAMDAQLRADQAAYPSWPDEERDLLPVRLGGSAPRLEEADALDAAELERRRSAS
jgi:1-acyl-sn-glycerol-3-phosphate acyltransferase